MKNFQITLLNGEIRNIRARDGQDAINYCDGRNWSVLRLIELIMK